ncbi:MAG: hypothetical protein U0800_02795 [Isosphaeraceae bacterium]
MFPSASQPEPRFPAGTRVNVVQFVRVGHRRWKTQSQGTVVEEGIRPVGGMEMGSKALYCRQPTVTLRKDDGELTVVTLDENTEIRPVDSPAGPP